MKKEKNLKLAQYILVGLVVLQVIVLGIIMLTTRGRGSGSRSGGNSSGFPLAIWVVIFVPLLVSRNKRKKTDEATKKKMLWVLVGLAILVLLGMIVFLLKAKGDF